MNGQGLSLAPLEISLTSQYVNLPIGHICPGWTDILPRPYMVVHRAYIQRTYLRSFPPQGYCFLILLVQTIVENFIFFSSFLYTNHNKLFQFHLHLQRQFHLQGQSHVHFHIHFHIQRLLNPWVNHTLNRLYL